MGSGRVEIRSGSIFISTIGIFRDRDEQKQILGRVGDLRIKFETRRAASGQIEESGKVEIILILLDSPTLPNGVILAMQSKYGRDKSGRPSQTLKIVEVSREKSRFNPTFPNVFDLKMAGKIKGKPNFPQLFVLKLGIAILILSGFYPPRDISPMVVAKTPIFFKTVEINRDFVSLIFVVLERLPYSSRP